MNKKETFFNKLKYEHTTLDRLILTIEGRKGSVCLINKDFMICGDDTSIIINAGQYDYEELCDLLEKEFNISIIRDLCIRI